MAITSTIPRMCKLTGVHWALLMILAIACGFARGEEWKLVWSDEFNGSGAPDPKVWSFEIGFIRGRELQVYTDRRQNVRQEDGMLVIEAHKEHVRNPAYDPASTDARKLKEFAEYSSASINTSGKKEFTFGRLEMRAQIPTGKGAWPAFWTLGANYAPGPGSVGWPACGEIDIMEFSAKTPEKILGSAHFAYEKKHHWKTGEKKLEGPPTGLHVYAVEWFSDRIDYYFDNDKYYSYATKDAGPGENNPFRKPHFILINFAVGGSLGGDVKGGEFPCRYLIDYVRVYQQESATGHLMPPRIGVPATQRSAG